MLKPSRSNESSTGKKISWFGLVKSLFTSKPKTKDIKKSKGWRWFLRGNKPKKYYPTLLASQSTINEAREEQRKQAVAVAVAMAAAADAAVAAARAASEVVHLTSVPQSYEEYEKRTSNAAATKIQTAYRAHLARKAFKALKGLVRLQALVRGRIVRRKIFTKLSCLRCSPPTSMAHTKRVHQIRIPNIYDTNKAYKKEVLISKEELEEEREKLRCNSRKHWDHSLISKEDIEALWLRKQDASVKRDRMKKYSFSHREGRNNRDLETLTNNQFDKKRETSKSNLDTKSVFIPTNGATKLKLKDTPKHDLLEELKFPFALPRRSFCHAKQKSFGDESSLPNSPNFPTYMAATESAKAKIRSTSTPRQRLGLCDSSVDYNSPYKARLSTWSTFNGDFGSSNGRRYVPDQISLSMNGFH